MELFDTDNLAEWIKFVPRARVKSTNISEENFRKIPNENISGIETASVCIKNEDWNKEVFIDGRKLNATSSNVKNLNIKQESTKPHIDSVVCFNEAEFKVEGCEKEYLNFDREYFRENKRLCTDKKRNYNFNHELIVQNFDPNCVDEAEFDRPSAEENNLNIQQEDSDSKQAELKMESHQNEELNLNSAISSKNKSLDVDKKRRIDTNQVKEKVLNIKLDSIRQNDITDSLASCKLVIIEDKTLTSNSKPSKKLYKFKLMEENKVGLNQVPDSPFRKPTGMAKGSGKREFSSKSSTVHSDKKRQCENDICLRQSKIRKYNKKENKDKIRQDDVSCQSFDLTKIKYNGENNIFLRRSKRRKYADINNQEKIGQDNVTCKSYNLRKSKDNSIAERKRKVCKDSFVISSQVKSCHNECTHSRRNVRHKKPHKNTRTFKNSKNKTITQKKNIKGSNLKKQAKRFVITSNQHNGKIFELYETIMDKCSNKQKRKKEIGCYRLNLLLDHGYDLRTTPSRLLRYPILLQKL